MQIVIDISKQDYNTIVTAIEPRTNATLMQEAIANGTPLPKGHGRLFDADALNKRMEQRMYELKDDESIWEASSVKAAMENFGQTIIEADKTGKEKQTE